MTRKRRGRPVHGWIVVDKPAGLTSTAVVGKVRRALDAAKAGHGGTLDPIATGLLPIALGEATKTVAYVMDGTKRYRFTIRWGEARDTDDTEGAVTETSPARPSADEVRAALPRFIGEVSQVPPAFSAIKVRGERAYDLARADRPAKLAPRTVMIHSLVLLDVPDADHAVLEMTCGKGTYVRALARDLARHIGTVGHLSQLRRTAVGPFDESHAISLDNIESLGHSPADFRHLLPVETALDDIPALAVTESEAARLRNGQPVPVLRTANRERIRDLADGAVLSAMLGGEGGELVALTRLEGNQVHPVRVLNF